MKKKLFAAILCLLLVLSFSLTGAETIYANLPEMSPTELKELYNKVDAEYDRATDVSSSASTKVCDAMEKAIEAQYPSAASLSYPFFGFSVSRSRCMYKVTGNTTIKFADKSKLSYDFIGLFWHDEAVNKYQLAVLIADKDVLVENDEYLAHIAEYLETSVAYIIGERKVQSLIPVKEPAYTVIKDAVSEKKTVSPAQTNSFDLSSATDEELEAALAAIKAEQRSRIKTKVVLSETELALDLKINVTSKLTAEVKDLPEGVKVSAYTWASSDKSVATCSQTGFVQALKSGNTVITCTATLSDGTMVEAVCNVSVIVKVSSIELTKASVILGIGETYTLAPIVYPANVTNPALSFVSSDPSVVSVDSTGVITAHSVGSASITISATDGSNRSAAFTAKVEVKSEIGMAKTSSDKITVTLDNVRTSAGNFLAQPESGNTFLIISYTVSNGASSSHSVAYDQFSAYSDNYKLDTSNTIWICDKYNFYDTIDSGSRIKGEFALEVEKNWKEITIKYETSSWFGDTITFTLYNK